MRLARLIRGAASLKDAELQFVLQVNSEGYVVVSDLQAYWQDDLFSGPPSVYVQANIRKEGRKDDLI